MSRLRRAYTGAVRWPRDIRPSTLSLAKSAKTRNGHHQNMALRISQNALNKITDIGNRPGYSTMSLHKKRIMYIERKAVGLEGTARIGRVTYSKSGRSLCYAGKEFIPIQGYKANYLETSSQEEYWISGPKKRGGDRLYGTGRVEIDDDVRDEYWTQIRLMPHMRKRAFYRD